MSGTTFYERNRDVILNRGKDYYENNKKLLRERAKNKYRELSENEKDVKRLYQRDRYHNMTAEEKQKLKEYQKIIVRLKSDNIKISSIEMDFSRINSVRLDKSHSYENQDQESYTRCLNPSLLIMVTHKNMFFRASLSSRMA